jgi:hypothetical protein
LIFFTEKENNEVGMGLRATQSFLPHFTDEENEI